MATEQIRHKWMPNATIINIPYEGSSYVDQTSEKQDQVGEGQRTNFEQPMQ
jgi:hypothetical protein